MTDIIVTNDAPAPVPIISVRNLTAGYGDNIILKDVSFEVREGEVLAILGRSGCGKSTLFKAMIGLVEPSEGEVIIDGDRICPGSEGGCGHVLRKVGVMFQSGALFSSMTLAENVAFPLRQFADLPAQNIEQVVMLKLSEVGLAGKEKLLPSELSGGMQKRAALARAMALDPKILFFDEPGAGLDPVTSAALDSLILRISQTLGTTVVIVTHELASIFAVADRVIMLDTETKGVIAEGSPRDLKEHSEDRRVRTFFNRSTPDGQGGEDV